MKQPPTATADDVQRLVWVRGLCASGAVRSLRHSAGLSLREVATAVGVSPTTVLRWEDGEARPTGRRALAYAEMLERLTQPSRRRAS